MQQPKQSSGEYLFVYGTLRHGAVHPLAERLRREAEYLGPGTANGRLFLLDGYPGMVGSEQTAELVYGDLYHLSTDPVLLQQLDAYEECAPEAPERSEFLRRPTRITTERGGLYTAWAYFYNRSTDQLLQIKSGDFFRESGQEAI